jgi:hypothetical protein
MTAGGLALAGAVVLQNARSDRASDLPGPDGNEPARTLPTTGYAPRIDLPAADISASKSEAEAPRRHVTARPLMPETIPERFLPPKCLPRLNR